MSTEIEASLLNLAELLRRRLEIIADHAWRERDSASHLEALKSVSLQIAAMHEALVGQVPARLNHFLSQCSYDKALEFIEGK